MEILKENMHANIFGHEVNDVFTKIGKAIDKVTGHENGPFTRIGSAIDDLTGDKRITIGSEKQSD